jgi:hypothetical protein
MHHIECWFCEQGAHHGLPQGVLSGVAIGDWHHFRSAVARRGAHKCAIVWKQVARHVKASAHVAAWIVPQV